MLDPWCSVNVGVLRGSQGQQEVIASGGYQMVVYCTCAESGDKLVVGVRLLTALSLLGLSVEGCMVVRLAYCSCSAGCAVLPAGCLSGS